MTETTDNQALTIAPPKKGMRPLKNNVFTHGRLANAQLAPMFPHAHPGAIVPCVAAFRSDGVSSGSFHHTNSVEEVAIVFGSNVPNFRTGQVMVGALEHNVQGPPAEFPAAFVNFCVAQRQAEDGQQKEALAFHCDKCHHELFKYEFDASEESLGDVALPVLPTIAGSEEAAVQFNATDRTCSECGHVSEPFPHDRWGWGEYVRRSDICETAYKQFNEAAENS